MRIIGVDTLYSKEIGLNSDEEIISYAEKTGRTIITRDKKLYFSAKKKNVRAIIISGNNLAKNISQILRIINVKPVFDPYKSFCPCCNSKVKEISKEEVRGKVSPEILSSKEVFWICTGCGKIYWVGSHHERIKKYIEHLSELLNNDSSKGV